ncbi:cathepsin B [Pelobates cultripes]|uniref:Cathepsin B n=1 Tax=Pelobates cultripes TaxID=61616 RepID=A0AAD1WUY3_PELCU|nr:cathepsin B [Pelobates cultripes]
MDLPENFDSQEAWPNCPTIREIRDQGSCGSRWTFGAMEAISDRTCVHSNGKVNVEVSAEDLLSCCGSKPYSILPCEHRVNGFRPACKGEEGDTPKCVKESESGNTPDYSTDKHFGGNSYHVPKDQQEIMADIYKNRPVEADFVVYSDFPTMWQDKYLEAMLLGC